MNENQIEEQIFEIAKAIFVSSYNDRVRGFEEKKLTFEEEEAEIEAAAIDAFYEAKIFMDVSECK